jgi:hypothetical protein
VARLTADNLEFMAKLQEAEAELTQLRTMAQELTAALQEQKGPWFDEVRGSPAHPYHLQKRCILYLVERDIRSGWESLASLVVTGRPRVHVLVIASVLTRDEVIIWSGGQGCSCGG